MKRVDEIKYLYLYRFFIFIEKMMLTKTTQIR
jgi:hypothetical protein